MPAYRKASIRDVVKEAYALDGRFVQGVLRRDAETGQWLVGTTPVETWLARNEGEDVTLIVLSMEDDRPLEKRVCRTCGREYTELECPHCREVRFRLRGR